MAYIDKSWETADGLNYAQTTEGTDSATSRYFIFAAEDEAEALAALREYAPATYAMGDKTLPLSTLAITGRRGETVWEGSVTYEMASDGPAPEQSLGGSFAFGAEAQPGATIGLVLDLITPSEARTGGEVNWYLAGAYQSTGPTYVVPTGTVGQELLAIYSHPDFDGDVQKSTQINDATSLGGAVGIDGLPPAQTGSQSTLTAILDEVVPVAAQTGGTYAWQQNGTTIGTGASVLVTEPGNVELTYSHSGYSGSLKTIVTPTGGDEGGGISHDTTISFSLSQTSTTKTSWDENAYQSGGGAYTLSGYNPDENGVPQGMEFMTSAFSFTATIQRSPNYFSMAFLNRLNALVNTVNAQPFLGFPAKSVLFCGCQGNRSGTRNADWWSLGLTFQVRRGEVVRLATWSNLTSPSGPTLQMQYLNKEPWAVLTAQYKTYMYNNKQMAAAVGWAICREYPLKDFSFLASEIGKVI